MAFSGAGQHDATSAECCHGGTPSDKPLDRHRAPRSARGSPRRETAGVVAPAADF
jgi:hypothetical protein